MQLLQVSVLVMVIEMLALAVSYHPRQESRFAGAHPSVLAPFCLAQHPSPSCPCHPQGSHPTVLPFPHHGLQTMNLTPSSLVSIKVSRQSHESPPWSRTCLDTRAATTAHRLQPPLPSPCTSSKDRAEAPLLGPTLS